MDLRHEIKHEISYSEQPLIRELYSKMTTQGLAPKIIVDYTREPFIFPAGNVRVTLVVSFICGFLADFITKSGNYKAFGRILIGYCVFSQCGVAMLVPLIRNTCTLMNQQAVWTISV